MAGWPKRSPLLHLHFIPHNGIDSPHPSLPIPLIYGLTSQMESCRVKSAPFQGFDMEKRSPCRLGRLPDLNFEKERMKKMPRQICHPPFPIPFLLLLLLSGLYYSLAGRVWTQILADNPHSWEKMAPRLKIQIGSMTRFLLISFLSDISSMAWILCCHWLFSRFSNIDFSLAYRLIRTPKTESERETMSQSVWLLDTTVGYETVTSSTISTGHNSDMDIFSLSDSTRTEWSDMRAIHCIPFISCFLFLLIVKKKNIIIIIILI